MKVVLLAKDESECKMKESVIMWGSNQEEENVHLWCGGKMAQV